MEYFHLPSPLKSSFQGELRAPNMERLGVSMNSMLSHLKVRKLFHDVKSEIPIREYSEIKSSSCRKTNVKRSRNRAVL